MTKRFNPGQGPPPTARLRVLATTDLHVHLLPYDYYTDRPQPASGLAQAASVIRALRAEMPEGACLLLDNGDALSGTLLSDLLAARFRLLAPPEGGERPVHPMIAAMNALGYDAGTLGNHEFDHGLPFLRTVLSDAEFAVLSANMIAAGPPLAAPWTIVERDLEASDGARARIRVGLLGVGPPQVAAWSAVALGDALRTRDILEAAREEIPRLRAAGADLVVAPGPAGIGGEEGGGLRENTALALAALSGIDALIVGHTHETFPDPQRPATAAIDPEASPRCSRASSAAMWGSSTSSWAGGGGLGPWPATERRPSPCRPRPPWTRRWRRPWSPPTAPSSP